MAKRGRTDYILIKKNEQNEPILYLLDEFKKPKTFSSKAVALQYIERTSEEELNEQGIFIELYSIWSHLLQEM